MARSLRIEYPGALYHITSRGDGQENIFLSDDDRALFIILLSELCARCNWICYAFCLMSNHYHLLIETPQGNLSKGMQLLNGIYTQKFNKSHNRVGHVFQGRYKGILVEKDCYLLELSRYIILNPVRANMVETAADWNWSSYNNTISQPSRLPWLSTELILNLFSSNLSIAVKKYKDFVNEGMGAKPLWTNLKKQIFLGSDDFVNEMQNKIDKGKNLINIPKPQYTPNGLTLIEYEVKSKHRNECIKLAYSSGQFSLAEIGHYYGLHYSRVSRIIKMMSDEYAHI